MDNEFKQRVMAAVGVRPIPQFCMCDGQECRSNCRSEKRVYRDPEHTAEGFLALWDALIAKGFYPDIRTVPDGFICNLCRYDTPGWVGLPDIQHQSGESNRAVALIRGAAAAFEVKEKE